MSNMIAIKNHTTGEVIMMEQNLMIQASDVAKVFGIKYVYIGKVGRMLTMIDENGTKSEIEIYAQVEAPKVTDGTKTITVTVNGQSESMSHKVKNGHVYGHPTMIRDFITKATSNGRYKKFYLMDVRLSGNQIHITFKHTTEAGRIQETVIGTVIGDLSHWFKSL
jgi:hypothetical protein